MALTWMPLDSIPTIKTNQVNMLETNLISTGNITIIKPIPQKVCEQFGVTCSFCRQQVPHPSPNQSDWSSKDWDGEKAKAKEQNPFFKSDTLKTEAENSTSDLVGSLPFQGFIQIGLKGTGDLNHTDSTIRTGSSGDSSKEWSNNIRHSAQRRIQNTSMGVKNAYRRRNV